MNYFCLNSQPLRGSDWKNPILSSRQPSDDAADEALGGEYRVFGGRLEARGRMSPGSRRRVRRAVPLPEVRTAPSAGASFCCRSGGRGLGLCVRRGPWARWEESAAASSAGEKENGDRRLGKMI